VRAKRVEVYNELEDLPRLGEQRHQLITVEAGVLEPLEAHRPAAV